jgi:hypothetical protein
MTEISRRVTLAWIAAASAMPGAQAQSPQVSVWPAAPPPLTAPGYGQDPAITTPKVPWPLTLSTHQRETLRIAADLMLPEDARSPSGGSLPLDAFIDEWISAPYPQQRADRTLILPGLQWLDAETMRRFGVDFTHADDVQRRAVFDTIAYRSNQQPEFADAVRFFARLRTLMLAGFYSLPQGIADIGYMGNQPIDGDYPGPTPEATAHLNATLTKLGLKPVTPG